MWDTSLVVLLDLAKRLMRIIRVLLTTSIVHTAVLRIGGISVKRLVLHLLNHARVICDERLHGRGGRCRKRTKSVSLTWHSPKWRRGRPWRRDVPSTTLGTPSLVLARTRSSRRSGSRAVFAAATRLVLVLRVLALVPRFLLLGQAFPIVFGLVVCFLPLIANDFRNFWISEARILENHASLVVLTVEYESCRGERNTLGACSSFSDFARQHKTLADHQPRSHSDLCTLSHARRIPTGLLQQPCGDWGTKDRRSELRLRHRQEETGNPANYREKGAPCEVLQQQTLQAQGELEREKNNTYRCEALEPLVVMDRYI